MDDTPISLRPFPSDHLDEAAVRAELTRVFDICHDCGRCLDRCGVFPTLVDLIGSTGTGEAGMLTPAGQDVIADLCHGCGACRNDCPYAPGIHPAGVDVPTLMARTSAMRRAAGQQSRRDRLAAFWLGAMPRSISVLNTTQPLLRRVVLTLTGLSTERRPGRQRTMRLSVWSARRSVDVGSSPRPVTVVPTCLVEFQRPDVGRALVGLIENAGDACDVAPFLCCGAPSYHAGDLRRFRRAAQRMVTALADRAVDGSTIVIPDATCAEVIRRRYPEVLAGPVVERVVAAVSGPVAHLARTTVGSAARGPEPAARPVPVRIVHSVAPAGPDDGENVAVVALLDALGFAVTVTERSIGGAGPWGLRASNDTTAGEALAALAATATESGTAVITCGDVHIALAGAEDAGSPTVVHPVEIIARASGIGEV